MGKWMKAEMADMIRELYDAGFRIGLIAQRCGMSPQRVRRAVHSRGNYRTQSNQNCSVDYKEIRRLASTEYHTLEDLGKRFGVTRERIRQILAGNTYDHKYTTRKKPPIRTVMSEFMKHVGGSFNPNNECVAWEGSRIGLSPVVFVRRNDSGTSVRNFIFRLYGCFLLPHSNVRLTCGTLLCVNPYHMETSVERNLRKYPIRYGNRVKGAAKFTAQSVIEVKRQLAAGKTAKAISVELGVRYERILHIRRGYTWREIPWPEQATP